MTDRDNQESRLSGDGAEYVHRADEARAAGDAALAAHLYLAAYERISSRRDQPSAEALESLRCAWDEARKSGERALAEYIFEKIEPYLNPQELDEFVDQLEDLELEHLASFGIGEGDLGFLSDLFSGFGFGEEMREDSSETATEESPSESQQSTKAEDAATVELEAQAAPQERATPSADESAMEAASALFGGLAKAFGLSDSDIEEARNEMRRLQEQGGKPGADDSVELVLPHLDTPVEKLDFSTLAGFGSTVALLQEMGIGRENDESFKNLVSLLNERHGLDSKPATDAILLRAPAREDADRLMSAVAGEVGLPSITMRMGESFMGLPTLTVTAQTDKSFEGKSLRQALARGGVLILEGLDLWGVPFADFGEESPMGFMAMQLTRGAREALGLIRMAVENPDVLVLASAGKDTEIDPFFLEMLEPLTFVDMENPTPEERVELWMDLARRHPSLRGINRADLVRYSANMPRYDIAMAVREAVEEAYKLGLASGSYQPVTRDNIFDKLAAYQPLDSEEYTYLEEAICKDFRAELGDLERFLDENN